MTSLCDKPTRDSIVPIRSNAGRVRQKRTCNCAICAPNSSTRTRSVRKLTRSATSRWRYAKNHIDYRPHSVLYLPRNSCRFFPRTVLRPDGSAVNFFHRISRRWADSQTGSYRVKFSRAEKTSRRKPNGQSDYQGAGASSFSRRRLTRNRSSLAIRAERVCRIRSRCTSIARFRFFGSDGD